MGALPPAMPPPVFLSMYHCSIQSISRGQGRSATACAAYRSGERIVCDREGRTHDYTRRSGVEGTMLVGWSSSRAELWNRAEASERRKDSCVAREIRVALPGEATPEDRRAMVLEYCERISRKYGVVCDAALHLPDRHGDARNYHAHIMITARQVDSETGAFAKKKDTRWNLPKSKETIEDVRQSWSDIWNEWADRTGEDAPRVDHRSYARQGLEITPTQHDGPRISGARRRGYIRSRPPAADPQDREISRENLEAELSQYAAKIARLERIKKHGPTIVGLDGKPLRKDIDNEHRPIKETRSERHGSEPDRGRPKDRAGVEGESAGIGTRNRTAKNRNPAPKGNAPTPSWLAAPGGIPRGGVMGPWERQTRGLQSMDAHTPFAFGNPNNSRISGRGFGHQWSSGEGPGSRVWDLWRACADTFRRLLSSGRDSDERERAVSPSVTPSPTLFKPPEAGRPPPVQPFDFGPDEGPTRNR